MKKKNLWPFFYLPLTDSRRAVVSNKVYAQVQVKGLNLPRNSVSRLTDQLDMDLMGWLGHQTSTQTKSLTECCGNSWNNLLKLYHSLGLFSRKQIGDIFHIFHRKQDLTFHANCLETICMKFLILFSGKNKKNIERFEIGNGYVVLYLFD